MKKLLFALLLLIGSLQSILAQTTNANTKNQTTPTRMNFTATFEQQILEFLHKSFPDSKSVSNPELKQGIRAAL